MNGVGTLLKEMGSGVGAVAVVVDQAVLSLDLGRDVLRALKATGYEPVVVAAVGGEPTVADATGALEAARLVAPVAVIGIGGGSALDLAKLTAVAASREDGVEAYFTPAGEIGRSLPLIAVPTTAGTGAEVTRISMISEAGRKRIVNLRALVPDVVVLDPALVMSLPPHVTASTGLDALCHAMEAMLSTNRSPLSMLCCSTALRLISSSLRESYARPHLAEARRGMLYGAYLAGLGLNAGVVLGHSIGYTIANRKHVAHGISCAIALPYCLRFNMDSQEPIVPLLANEILGTSDPGALVRWVHELNDDLGVPASLSSLGIAQVELNGMASECADKYPRPNNPVAIRAEGLQELYAALFDGDRSAAPFRNF